MRQEMARVFPSFVLVALGCASACGHPGGAPRVTVTTLAGNGIAGFIDGTGGRLGTTEFDRTGDVAVDAAGTVYVTDFNNNRVRRVAPDGTTTTLTGNGKKGYVDGTGGPQGTTQFFMPRGIAVDGTGSCDVVDGFPNPQVRRIAPSGDTTTLAGNGAGFTDGTGGPSGTAQFGNPEFVAFGPSGNLLVADFINSAIRVVDPVGNTTTLAGNGFRGWVDGTGGMRGTTEFNFTAGVAADDSGNTYVTDGENNTVRRVAPNGSTITISGNGTAGFADGTGGRSGTAELDQPIGIAVSHDGTVYVADSANNRIRAIALDGTMTTLAGDGTIGDADGDGPHAQFYAPAGLALGPDGSLYVADQFNNRVRKITFSKSN